MKILLINPPITSIERYGRDLGDIGGHQAPLGLCSLAAYLEREGHSVRILDAEMLGLSPQGVAVRARLFAPAIAGVTCTTVGYPKACDTARELRAAMPDLPILIGGPHVTSNPRETLRSGLFDAAVLREGEASLAELLRAVVEGRPLSEVRGIAYTEGGRVVINPPQPYLEDLDALPFPAFHLLENREAYLPALGCYLNKPVTNLVTSRGCPYDCIFCDKTVFGRRYRFHSADYVLQEAAYVAREFGAREIAFLDDSFTVRRDRVMAICKGLRQMRPALTWTCMTRANLVDKEMLREMKRAGCWQIAIGVESADQRILDLSRKGETVEDIERCIRDAAGIGMMVKGFFMLGLPGETRKSIAQTLAFARSVPLTDVVVTLATPMPGSEFYDMAARYGEHRQADWSRLSYWEPVFTPRGLSGDFLVRARSHFERRFYARAHIAGRQLRKIRDVEEFLKYVRNVWRVVRSHPHATRSERQREKEARDD